MSTLTCCTENKFDNFDLVRTSPLYYIGMAEREESTLNFWFFDRSVGMKLVSFDPQNGQIIAYKNDGKISKKSSERKTKSSNVKLCEFVFLSEDFLLIFPSFL